MPSFEEFMAGLAPELREEIEAFLAEPDSFEQLTQWMLENLEPAGHA